MKTLEFNQQADVIPLHINVEQLDGSNKIVSLSVSTNTDSIVELIEKVNSINSESKNFVAKYPALSKEKFDDANVEEFKEANEGISEWYRLQYDTLFGEGAYQKLYDAGLGVMKLVPLLEDLTDGIGEELQSKVDENRKKSAKRKADLLIKNKKKQK